MPLPRSVDFEGLPSGQGGAEQRFELVLDQFVVVARREQDLRLVGIEDDSARVMDDDPVVRLRGEEDVPDDRVRELVGALYGNEVSWNVPLLRSFSPVTEFVKWSWKRLCTMVRTTSPLLSKNVAPKVFPVVKSDMSCPSQVAKCGSNSEFVSRKRNGRAACELEAKTNKHAMAKAKGTRQRILMRPPLWNSMPDRP